MLLDKTKFDEIVAREQAILNTLKEPELHWYSQTNLLKVLAEVGALLTEAPKSKESTIKKVTEDHVKVTKKDSLSEVLKTEKDAKEFNDKLQDVIASQKVKNTSKKTKSEVENGKSN